MGQLLSTPTSRHSHSRRRSRTPGKKPITPPCIYPGCKAASLPAVQVCHYHATTCPVPGCRNPQARTYDPWFGPNDLCFNHQPDAILDQYYWDAMSGVTSSTASTSSTMSSKASSKARARAAHRKQQREKARQRQAARIARIVVLSTTRRPPRRKFDDRDRDIAALLNPGGFLIASAISDGYIRVES